MTRYFQEMHPPSFKRGTNDFARFYGLLIDGIQIGYVNGFAYNQVMPAPESEIPARFPRAEQVFAQKLWREQLHDWDEKSKPSSVATHRDLQAVNPDALPDAELAAYLKRCRDHHSAMIAQHMRFTAGALAPNRGFPRSCWGLDRLAPRRAAGPDARFRRGVLGWFRRDGAPEGGVH
jgi:pyruvate,water dikinase